MDGYTYGRTYASTKPLTAIIEDANIYLRFILYKALIRQRMEIYEKATTCQGNRKACDSCMGRNDCGEIERIHFGLLALRSGGLWPVSGQEDFIWKLSLKNFRVINKLTSSPLFCLFINNSEQTTKEEKEFLMRSSYVFTYFIGAETNYNLK